MNALQIIQQKLKSPKSQYNSFGKYNYRNQEDILEAVKPLLIETNATLTLSDEIVEIGGCLFVKTTASLINVEKDTVIADVSAYAMHAKEQKGMNEAQITGAASSYARKYALNGLFLIDDTKDADATNNGANKEIPKVPKPAKVPTPKKKDILTLEHKSYSYVKDRIKNGNVPMATIEESFEISEEVKKKLYE